MIEGRLGTAATITGGVLHGADAGFRGISTDTRLVAARELYLGLRGARVDGTTLVAEALQAGAAGALVEALQPGGYPQVVVADSRRAFGELARDRRARFQLPLIGITGSNGKTTTKEMIAAIMRAALAGAGDDALLVTWGNLNNEIGLPRTLSYLGPQHRAAVIEMGAARRGDIAYLARIAQPTVSILTNAGRAHLETFGSVEDVALGKGEIFDALDASGAAVINRDDRFFQSWWQRASGRRRVSFGLHPDAEVRATDIVQPRGAGELRFTLRSPAGTVALRLEMLGQHNVMNALAAAAACMAAGVDLATVARGLGDARNVSGRLHKVPARDEITLFDDTYNANPGSVRAAIGFLESLPGERWLVLGDMAELGPDSDAMHREMGQAARRAGVTRLYCAGTHSRAAADVFGTGATWREDVPALAELVAAQAKRGITVLVKGSRSMGMERVVAALADDSAAGQG
jgi:UDP-N-acetylmuramoyl-tripeptide--D-alanyl-D-alanine ligase